MTTITREQLRERAREKVKSLEFAVTQTAFAENRAELEKELELARIALASLEAEAVTNEIVIPEPATHRNINEICPPGVNQTLFASGWNASRKSGMNSGRIPPIVKGIDAECVGWNACRAAMLHGAESRPELTVWYGSMPETNGKTNWTAMLHRKGQYPWDGITIECSEYPDRVRYEADRMRHLIGELSDEPDILAYDADAHSGYVKPSNSPVIQDGWIKCSERMPEDEQEVLTRNRMGHCFVSFFDEHSGLFFDRVDVAAACCIEHILVTHWMPLPAAPQQEE